MWLAPPEGDECHELARCRHQARGGLSQNGSGRRGAGRQGCSWRERRSDDLRQTIRDLVCKSSRMFSMQECIASWAHLFANFSWWGCLMIVVAGVQSDVYHRKVKVVSPRMRTPTSWATGRSARRQATAPSARSARPTSRLESCASSCCITGRYLEHGLANMVVTT